MNFLSVDVPLAQRMFLIGPNASGKSNLLSVFRFFRDMVKPGGGFQKAVMDRGGVGSLRCLAARKNPNIELDVQVGVPEGTQVRNSWRYRIEFGSDAKRTPILKTEEIWRNDEKILERPDPNDRADPLRLTQTHLEQVNVNERFRELCRFFESVQYVHFVPHVMREPERYVARKDDPYGGDFLEKLARMRPRDRQKRLRTIEQLLHVTVPQLKNLRFDYDSRGTPHLKTLYEHWRPRGAWQNERQFSDGTLRLVGFLWSLLDKEGPLLLEEPELSLHPGIVRRLPRLIRRLQKTASRQVMISTHSSDLLSDIGIGVDEVLILEPDRAGGSRARVGKEDDQIRTLMEMGASVAEAALPATEPANVRQLELFPEEEPK